MSQEFKPKGAAPFAPSHKVKLCGLYKQKRKKDGKTYLVGRCSYSAKYLVLPNDEKKADNEPDFWVFLVDDPAKPKTSAPQIAQCDDRL